MAMLNPAKCPHANFSSMSRVGRLSETEGGPITAYTVDVTITCSDCGLPFRFLGLPAGYHYAEPRVSADGTKLRAPIEPAYVTEIAGMPLVAGRA